MVEILYVIDGDNDDDQDNQKYKTHFKIPNNSIKYNLFVFQGVIIKDVVNGTECEVCNDNCPGFQPHSWR